MLLWEEKISAGKGRSQRKHLIPRLIANTHIAELTTNGYNRHAKLIKKSETPK